MARKRRLHRRYGKKKHRSNPAPRSNPPLLAELLEYGVPGFGGFAASRALTRIVAVQVARKKPSWGKHAGVGAALATLAAAWWGANKIKALEKYHAPIVVGSAIAAAQSIIQLYIPKLGWLLSDATPQMADELAAPAVHNTLPPGVELLDDDPNEYTYNDSYDNGASSSVPPQNQAQAKVAGEDALLADLNLDDSADLNLGSLG